VVPKTGIRRKHLLKTKEWMDLYWAVAQKKADLHKIPIACTIIVRDEIPKKCQSEV
jgi:hypothetical protein